MKRRANDRQAAGQMFAGDPTDTGFIQPVVPHPFGIDDADRPVAANPQTIGNPEFHSLRDYATDACRPIPVEQSPSVAKPDQPAHNHHDRRSGNGGHKRPSLFVTPSSIANLAGDALTRADALVPS